MKERELHEFALREGQLLRQMEAAITEFEARGKPFTQNDLCELVGMSRTGLRNYPRVNAFLEQKLTRHHGYQRRRMPPTEEELVQRVKEAIVELSDHGEHITLRKVARQVKITDEVLLQYPQEELLHLVKDAINGCKASGEPITKERVSGMMGVDRAALLRYPEVRALMTQAANEDQQQRREMRYQEREEEVAQQVVNAIQQLRDSGKRVSVHAVGKIVHLSYVGLHYYPKVRAILESAIAAQPPTSKSA